MSVIIGEFGKIRLEGKIEGFKQGFNEGLSQGLSQGRIDGAKEVIVPLLELYSISELAGILDKSVDELNWILK